MNIGVLGSGMVGQGIAAALVAGGHQVTIGTRDASKLAEWHTGVNAQAVIGSFAEAAAAGEIVFNCTLGAGTLAALHMAGADKLNGKILIDISNPLDFSQGFPPSLFVSNTDSLGEQIQRAFPAVKVVKTLNTLAVTLMVNPGLLNEGDHTIFLSGNDAAAKSTVKKHLMEWFGWREEGIIDLGDITTARGTEMLLPVWVRLYGAFGSPLFNFKVVK